MSVTFGSASAPSQITLNLDSLFAQSLAAYRKTLIDNIAATNAFIHEMMSGELYQSQDGGAYIQVPLLYALQSADTYSGYDDLPTVPVDGITAVEFDWTQCASAIVYSMLEVKKNKQRITNFVESKIKQADLGLQESYAQWLMWGSVNQGGTLKTPYVSTVNGSTGINPISMLIDYTPSVSATIGNINQSTSSWWRNKTKTSTASAYDAFLLEVDNIYNSCSLGSGGKPKIVLLDQVTYELFVHAIYQKFRYTAPTDQAYPFENVVYRGTHFVMDDKVPDVAGGVAPSLLQGSGDPTSISKGSMFFINPQFMNMIYEEDSDFKMLSDDGGKTMFKPVNGDSRVGHFAWMGNTTISNRRKQGVMGSIARSLT